MTYNTYTVQIIKIYLKFLLMAIYIFTILKLKVNIYEIAFVCPNDVYSLLFAYL